MDVDSDVFQEIDEEDNGEDVIDPALRTQRSSTAPTSRPITSASDSQSQPTPDETPNISEDEEEAPAESRGAKRH
jgi:hypothetical protein